MSFLINRKEFVQMPLLFISFTGVSSYGNFRLSFGHAACPLGARCLPHLGTLLAPVGHNRCLFHEVLLSLPMIVVWKSPGGAKRHDTSMILL